MSEYDARDDGEKSYLAAIEAKRLRGDDYYLLPHKDFRFLRSIPEGVSCIIGRYLSAQCLYQRSGGSFAHRAVNGPGIGHKDFCCSFQGSDVDAVSADQDAHFGGKPNSARHGA